MLALLVSNYSRVCHGPTIFDSLTLMSHQCQIVELRTGQGVMETLQRIEK